MVNEAKLRSPDSYCPQIIIIILNWNSWSDTIECLESVLKIKYNSFQIIIVDNASEDDSVEKIVDYLKNNTRFKSNYLEYNSKNNPIKGVYNHEKEENDSKYTQGITVIVNNDNYGFAKGNNIAIKYAKKRMDPDYVLLLNNDTTVDENFLEEMVKTAEISGDFGFIGPKVYYYDYNGRKDVINFAGGFLNMWKCKAFHRGINEIDKGQLDTTKEVDYVQGSCLLVKMEVIEKIGLMNPDYFMYWEEADWCFRGREMGYKSIFTPKSKIWHKTMASSGSYYSFNNAYHYMTKNRFIFMKNNANNLELLSFLFYYFLVNFWVDLANLLLKGDRKTFSGFLKGIKEGIFYFLRSDIASS